MSEPLYRMDVMFGYVRVEQRNRTDAEGWVRHESRLLEYDYGGGLHHVGEWEETGLAGKWV